MPEHLFNIKEAADYLGIDEKKLKALVRRRLVPAYRIGGAYIRFRKDQLNIARGSIHEPARANLFLTEEVETTRLDRIKDFLYFNDFYIVSIILVILAIAVIFTS